MTQLNALLGQIDTETMVLPEFQRGYVWSRDQVRGLLRSLYLNYPVGGLLVWETDADAGAIRGKEDAPAGVRSLLLDGQQRLTSLYGVMRGKPPKFFEGDSSAFLDLYFNVVDETFEFYAPAKMKTDPRWISVTRLFTEGMNPFIDQFRGSEYDAQLADFLSRISQLANIANRDFHVEKIAGSDKTIDVVVDIFNRVNSGGTKLSKGDLALAKIASANPKTRERMREELGVWKANGYDFSLDWLLRNVTAVATGRAQFSFLDQVNSKQFDQALHQASAYINTILNLLADRLGLDHGRVLLSRYAIAVLTRYLHLHDGKFPDRASQDQALYWYIQAGIWGRFSTSQESRLSQDFETLETGGLKGVIDTIARSRGGSLTVLPVDFTGYSMGSRFYPMLYMLTRVLGAQDLLTGVELRQSLLGKLSALQVHHVFPKKQLYDVDYTRGEVNAVANFAFLTQESNLAIGKRPPLEYFQEIIDAQHEEALRSQWIPLDKGLWTMDRYPEFLAARRELLAEAANSFLENLIKGSVTDSKPQPRGQVMAETDEDPREQEVTKMLELLAAHAVVLPQRDVEIYDPSGHLIAVAEAYWPDGLQPGRGEPTMLELDHERSDIERLQALGYRVFTSTRALVTFVEHEAAVDSGALSA